jgi:hypothetical protein
MIISKIDPEARKIHLKDGVYTYHPKDIYRQVIDARWRDDLLRCYEKPFEYYFIDEFNRMFNRDRYTLPMEILRSDPDNRIILLFKNGWRIVPHGVKDLIITGWHVCENNPTGVYDPSLVVDKSENERLSITFSVGDERMVYHHRKSA